MRQLQQIHCLIMDILTAIQPVQEEVCVIWNVMVHLHCAKSNTNIPHSQSKAKATMAQEGTVSTSQLCMYS